MNQIDKMLNNIMGTSKKKSKNNMFNKSFITPKSTIKSTKGASINMQKNQFRRRMPDSNGDRISNKFDCQPMNIMRQDVRTKEEKYYKVIKPMKAYIEPMSARQIIGIKYLVYKPFEQYYPLLYIQTLGNKVFFAEVDESGKKEKYSVSIQQWNSSTKRLTENEYEKMYDKMAGI